MRLPLGKAIGALVFANLFALSSAAVGQEQYTLTPSLSVSETYDDNIFLDSDGKTEDFITTVSPAFTLNIERPRQELQLNYSPSIVRYSHTSENNTVRHLGNVIYRQDVAQNLKFEFTDTYLKSEDPLETTFGVETNRRNRNPYQRNNGEVRMGYVFGRENTVTAGYRNSLLLNEDPTVDDGTTHQPFVDYIQWFDAWNGMGISYDYTAATFSNDTRQAQPNYTGHNPALRYLRRFDPQTSGYVSYEYTTRNFDTSNFNSRENYTIHTFMVGADKQFSPRTAVGGGLGYFIQVPDVSASQSGPSYNAYLRKTYQRGNFFIGGAGGWSEQYLQAEDRGFVKYYSVDANGEYTFLERLSGYGRAGYRIDQYQNNNAQDDTWRASAGLRWAFHRYVSLLLDYTHVSRTSDNPLNEYDDNRYMVILTGSRPYIWK